MTDPRIEAAVDAAWSHTTQFSSGETFDQYSKRKPYEGGEFRKSIVSALAAADAAAWRPMNEAPRNGTLILVAVKHIGCDVVSWWGAGWRETTNGLMLRDEPTHWQPLPAPPGNEVNA